MKQLKRSSLLAVGIAGLALTIPTVPRPAPRLQQREAFADSPTKPSVLADYGKLPLSFESCLEANCGVSDGSVNFVARGRGYTLFLTPVEAVLSLRRTGDRSPDQSNRAMSAAKTRAEEPAPAQPPSVVRMKLVGADPSSRWEALEELSGKSNYFLGNDPTKWRTNVANYAKVRYRDVYPGIDLVYYGNQGQLEYDFVVAPGADPRQIELAFEGAEKLRADTDGDLVVQAGGEELRLRQPLVYQVAESGRQEIVGRYVLRGKKSIVFELASYDPNRLVVIDPVLVYSTYLGGNDDDQGNGIAVDSAGNAYITGSTGSTNFPTASAFQPVIGEGTDGPARKTDAFVTKINATGTALVYSTYLGGTGPGSLGPDAGKGIAVDFSGNAYVTGTTRSLNFPVTPGAFATSLSTGGGCRTNGFVTKLNASGAALSYSTYIPACQIAGNGIAVDSFGNAHVVGTVGGQSPTASHSFVFVLKLNATGTALIYYTHLGSNGFDQGWGIAVDSSGSAYVTGRTNATDFPLVNALQNALGGGMCFLPFANFGPCPDAFVTKLNPTGTIVYSTYLGGYNSDSGSGNAGDFGNSIAVDSSGNAYVTGLTNSTNFPTANAFQPVLGGAYDAFVAKLNARGTALVYSTYLGGSSGDAGSGIAVGSDGNVYVTGATLGANFPITSDAFQVIPWGGSNVFVTKLNSTGAIAYSTFLSGRDPGGGFPPGPIAGNSRDYANGIAVDILGNAYVAGGVNSLDFPTVNPIQAAFGGGPQDAFIAKIADPPQMITNLIRIIASLNFQQGIRLLQNAIAAINAGNSRAACNQLEAFLNQVQAQSGKQLTTTQAAQLTGAATQIRAALGCP